MFQWIKNISLSNYIIEILFTSLIISVPFGSHIFAVSIGFMTIYPFLILVGILTILGFFHIRLISSKIEIFFLLFLLFWLLYAIGLSFISGFNEDAIIDIRSLLMMCLTSWVIIWTKSKLGNIRWQSVLGFSLKIVFFLLLFFSLFEFVSGIHFEGSFTNQMLLDSSGSINYAPIFLYDNANNVVAHMLICSALILLLEKNLKSKPIFIAFLLIVDLFIAVITSARIGTFISVTSIILTILNYAPSIYSWAKAELNRSKVIYIVITIVVMLLVFFKTDKYYGPYWVNQTEVVQSETVNVESPTGTEIVEVKTAPNKPLTKTEAENMNNDSLRLNYNSFKIRYGLLQNGIAFFRESNYLGIGPGQFRVKHKNGEIDYYTKTNISPHAYIIEVLAQFGALITALLLFLMCLLIYSNWKMNKDDKFKFGIFIISLLLFVAASFLPSGFLILEFNWIFVATLVGVSSNNKKRNGA